MGAARPRPPPAAESSRNASSVDWRSGEWRTAARGVTRDTRWQWRGQWLRQGSCWEGGTPCAGRVALPEPPATGAPSQAPLRGAGTGGGGPPVTGGLSHTQPTGSAQPGAEHFALGGETPPPPPH